jgi:methylenetetrahydrofolate reductase (NADPH)
VHLDRDAAATCLRSGLIPVNTRRAIPSFLTADEEKQRVIPEQLSGMAPASAQMPLLRSIETLARSASIETSTRTLAEIDTWPTLLPQGTDVFVAWIPGSPRDHIVSVAKRLRQVGMNPVPHIAARQLANRAAAAEYLASLRGEADVTRVLIIGGDTDAPAGAYDSSAALLETGLLQEHGVRSIGITGYPEGHPKIPEPSLAAALDRKIAYAGDHGIELFMVTQFCFDGQVILDWLGRLRARGVILPLRVGVAGPATLRTLFNYAMRCGIGNSIRALGSQAISLTRLLTQHGPEKVVRCIAASQEELGIAGLHLFPFGGFARSAQWIDNVGCGRFRLGEPDEGFSIQTDNQVA